MAKAGRPHTSISRPRLIIPVGTRYGRLSVISEAPSIPRTPHRGVHRYLNLICDCGGIATSRLNDLRNGRINSCGCLGRERNSNEAIVIHGEAGKIRTPEYRSWLAIKFRCTNENFKGWKYWGGRGIKICQKWENNYLAFLQDVGRKPSKYHSIDRYPDNDGDYEPHNVRWATKSEQAYNRRKKGTA